MNKPVILAEDTLAAPVIADDASVPKVPSSAAPALTVLGAISLSHFLNDLMQSLIPSVYPHLKEN